MPATGQPDPFIQLKIVWLSLLGSPLMIWIALIVMDELSVLPEAEFIHADYILYTGLILILPGAYMLRLFKSVNRSYLHHAQSTGQGEPSLDKVKMYMMLGMTVADVPATLSIVYYVVTGEMEKSVVLVASSFIMCFFFKPELPN